MFREDNWSSCIYFRETLMPGIVNLENSLLKDIIANKKWVRSHEFFH